MRRECREGFPPPPTSKEPVISDHNMHHGTCVTHVPWCMSGSLTRGGGKTFPTFLPHAQTTILRIWQEAHGAGTITQVTMWTSANALFIHSMYRIAGIICFIQSISHELIALFMLCCILIVWCWQFYSRLSVLLPFPDVAPLWLLVNFPSVN